MIHQQHYDSYKDLQKEVFGRYNIIEGFLAEHICTLNYVVSLPGIKLSI